ncbi:hypothetical protein VPNG_05356 [Cytospora leucostoma]|uniref:peptide-methionine (S)-S-oxide reductase n=1 Tax=Cytospora leucostoma TaxID=1230097 RepID=A0A423X4G0_9PEZI|nr:hypothetical protein VPNG_05356 [Cytospora leucostoma]
MLPNFLARLARPFSTATVLGVASAESGIGAAAASSIPEGAQKCTVAAGCFWGVEHIYRKHFEGKGLYAAPVGYIGGDAKNPSYRAVCTGRTGHAEATQIVFDPERVTYRELLEFFYRMHDPTTKNKQGGDTGTQYRSGIFYHDEEQKRIAQEVTAAVNEQWYGGRVATEIVPAGQWWDAEEYHQLYLDKNPYGYQCASHYVRDHPPLK